MGSHLPEGYRGAQLVMGSHLVGNTLLIAMASPPGRSKDLPPLVVLPIDVARRMLQDLEQSDRQQLTFDSEPQRQRTTLTLDEMG